MDYKKITMAEWKATPKDYKSIIDGVRYKLYYTVFGTTLCPIKIIKK